MQPNLLPQNAGQSPHAAATASCNCCSTKGGGTLNLTLCRVLNVLLVQIANDGTEEVGGDVFDEELRNEVERRSRSEQWLEDDIEALPEALKRLTHECKKANIRLSNRSTCNVFVDPYYQNDHQSDLQMNLSRADIQDIVSHLIKKGIARIERLLEQEAFFTPSVELCLATGGMVNMPMVKDRLDGDCLLVRVPLNLPKKFMLQRFKSLLDENHKGQRGKRYAKTSKSKCQFTGQLNIEALTTVLNVLDKRIEHPKMKLWELGQFLPLNKHLYVDYLKSGKPLDTASKKLMEVTISRFRNARESVANTSKGFFP